MEKRRNDQIFSSVFFLVKNKEEVSSVVEEPITELAHAVKDGSYKNCNQYGPLLLVLF